MRVASSYARSLKSAFADKLDVFRYNQKWTWPVTHVLFTVVLCGFLGGMATENKPGELGRLLTPEDVSEILQGMFSSQPLPAAFPHPHTCNQPTLPSPPPSTSLEFPASFLTKTPQQSPSTSRTPTPSTSPLRSTSPPSPS